LFPGAAGSCALAGTERLPSAFQVVVLPHSLSWLDPAYGAYGAMMKGRYWRVLDEEPLGTASKSSGWLSWLGEPGAVSLF